MEREKTKGLTTHALKCIAVLAMTLDHIAWVFWQGYSTEPLPLFLHLLGRITCPVMCYFIAEGYWHTRSRRRYLARLFAFALLSHFAYVFFSPDFRGWHSFLPFSSGEFLDQTSVIWSLFLGLLLLCIAHAEGIKTPLKVAFTLLVCLVAFPADWSSVASLTVLAFGTNRGKFRIQMGWMLFYVAIYATVYALCLDPVYGILQMGVALSIPLLWQYNGKRGGEGVPRSLSKWGFYLYYPLHLAALGALRFFALFP